MKRRTCLLFAAVFLAYFFKTDRVFAMSSVVINEIAWMGTIVSGNDEWIELYNRSQTAINLDGWILKSADGTPEIKLSGVIQPNGFYLLERTDDNSVPEISADQIYSGALSNSGENLTLTDNSGSLIDEVKAASGWFAGDNKTKQTMERIGQNWQTSQNARGTPKNPNSEALITNQTPSPLPTPIPTTIPKNYPSGIIFNELLPAPKGKDSEEEWIEIYNQNNFSVDLAEWKISDSVGTSTNYYFPKNSEISALGYIVLKRPDTKIVLNNQGDQLNLFYPNGNTADSISFKKAITGQSLARFPEEWLWTENLTPGKENQKPSVPEKISLTSEDDQKPSFKTNLHRAAISEDIPEKKSFIVFIIALVLAAVFGSLIVFLKRILKNSRI